MFSQMLWMIPVLQDSHEYLPLEEASELLVLVSLREGFWMRDPPTRCADLTCAWWSDLYRLYCCNPGKRSDYWAMDWGQSTSHLPAAWCVLIVLISWSSPSDSYQLISEGSLRVPSRFNAHWSSPAMVMDVSCTVWFVDLVSLLMFAHSWVSNHYQQTIGVMDQSLTD